MGLSKNIPIIRGYLWGLPMVGYVVDAKIRASDKDLTVLDFVHKAGKGCVSLTTY